MNNKQLAIVAAGVIAIGVIAAILLKKPGGQVAGTPAPVSVDRTVNLFHPDTVKGLQWKTKAKTIAFTRKSRDDKWTPTANPQDIQDRLNLLAAADYEKLETKGPTLIDVTVAFGDKNQWEGVWDGTYFYWKTGDHAGFGFQPKRHQILKFESGRFAFEGEKLDWCPARIKTFTVKAGTLDYQLRQQGLKWIIGAKEVDPTFIEQWFGRACSNKLEEYLDPEVAKERKLAGEVTTVFANGKTVTWKKEPDGPTFNDGAKTFVSPNFATHINELGNAPVIGDAPPPEAEAPKAAAKTWAPPAAASTKKPTPNKK